MNIFFLDVEPKKCVQYHVNSHTTKMCVEYAQLLCSAHWCSGGEAPYKLTHQNHPCNKWVRENIANYVYLCDIAIALCDEYTHRYGKVHKSKAVIEWCMSNFPNIPYAEEYTTPPLAMPDEYKNHDSFVDAYRDYYIGDKQKIAKWTNREKPFWYKLI